MKTTSPRLGAVALAGFALLCARPAAACTAFLLPGIGAAGSPLVGKCYDWSMGQGFVVVNPRGLKKSALATLPTDHPAEWEAKFASVTFNQYGREFPNGGMNEAGLVVEVLWLDASRFEPADERPTVNELQWVQYQLDRHATVGEVVAAAPTLRIAKVHGAVHYFACDRGGACATFELLDGKLAIATGKGLAAPILTNDPYARDAEKLREYSGFGGSRAIPDGMSSPERFVRAAALTRAPGKPSRVEAEAAEPAFSVLDTVNNPRSQWQVVYEPARGRIHFRTRASNRKKWIDVGRVTAGAAGGCAQKVRFMNIDVDLEGDVSSFLGELSDAANRRLVMRSFADLVDQLPAGAVDEVARYPSLSTCAR